MAFVASLAYLLIACAAGTPEPTAPATPQAAVEPPSVTGTEHTLEAGSGWPEGTGHLEPVVFRVTVSEGMEATLLRGNEGHLFVMGGHSSTLAKMVFRNGERAAYEMPAGYFWIKGVGQSFICRNAFFYIPADTRRDTDIDIAISEGEDELKLHLEKRQATIADPVYRGNFICRTSVAWAAWDEKWGTKVADDPSKGGKLALKVLKYLVLVPLVGLGSVGGGSSW
jgi:hypothetical protein